MIAASNSIEKLFKPRSFLRLAQDQGWRTEVSVEPTGDYWTLSSLVKLRGYTDGPVGLTSPGENGFGFWLEGGQLKFKLGSRMIDLDNFHLPEAGEVFHAFAYMAGDSLQVRVRDEHGEYEMQQVWPPNPLTIWGDDLEGAWGTVLSSISSSSGRCSFIGDFSGKGRNASQSNHGNRFLSVSNGLNGQTVLAADSTACGLEVNSFPELATPWYMAVAQHVHTPDVADSIGGNTPAVFRAGPSGSQLYGSHSFSIQSAFGGGLRRVSVASLNGVAPPGFSTFQGIHSTQWPANQWLWCYGGFNPATNHMYTSLYRNKQQHTVSPFDLYNSATGKLILGNGDSYSQSLANFVYWLVLNREPTDNELLKFSEFVEAYYGIQEP